MITTAYITRKDGTLDCLTFQAGSLEAAQDKKIVRLLCDIVSGAGDIKSVTFDRQP